MPEHDVMLQDRAIADELAHAADARGLPADYWATEAEGYCERLAQARAALKQIAIMARVADGWNGRLDSADILALAEHGLEASQED